MIKLNNGRLKCPDCCREFDSRDEYLAHRQAPCMDSNAIPINEKIPRFVPIEQIKGKKNGDYTCEFCGKICKNARGLKAHQTYAHDINVSKKVLDARKKRAKLKRQKELEQSNQQEVVKVEELPKVEEMIQNEPTQDLVNKNMLLCNGCKVLWITKETITHCPKCGKPLYDVVKEVRVINLEFR